MFPEVRFTYKQTVLIKSSHLETYYLGVRTIEGNHSIIIKQLENSKGTNDPELQLKVCYFTAAEATESKLVLLMHKATGTCFRMSNDQHLVLEDLDINNNSENDVNNSTAVPTIHDYRSIKHADSRFFYQKDSAPDESSFVFEAMNGVHSGYLLVFPSENEPPGLLLVKAGRQYPDEARIEYQDCSNTEE